MTTIIKEKLGYQNAKLWRDSQSTANENDPVVYVFVGNHVPYANEASPDSIVDTIVEEKGIYDNIFAAKKITGNDVELVVPRFNWSTNTVYQHYDDTVDANTQITANTTSGVQPIYVITSDRNVYKCMSNNSSANSTVEPTGDYTTSNGNIGTSDGYIWKYMYNVKPSNKFLNSDWIPSPHSTTQLDYGMSNTGVVDGELTTIIVTNGGSNYYHSIVTVDAFANSCTTLTLANTTNISANMKVAGTGVLSGSYITNIDTPNNKITLSSATTANGGGSGNNLTITTRVYIEGDGTGAEATADVSGGNVTKITVSTIGTGYARANAIIFGSGTNATARVIKSPKLGHAYNPAKDLNATNVMFTSRVGEIDSTENGLISTDTSIRQYGLLVGPHKYGNSSVITHSTANSVISQTHDITMVAGSSFTLNEYVYQGDPNNAVFSGFVNAQSTNLVRLTKVLGTFQGGLDLVGATSGVTRTPTGVNYPEFTPYTGDIVYTENITKIDRSQGQAENLKIVLKF